MWAPDCASRVREWARMVRMATFDLDLRFNADGLLPAIAQDATSGEVLMLAWMDAEALRRTLGTRRATYWSRSRGEYWVKGETSGHVQQVVSVAIDCDNDTILLQVNQTGAACHTGNRTCFFTEVLGTAEDVALG